MVWNFIVKIPFTTDVIGGPGLRAVGFDVVQVIYGVQLLIAAVYAVYLLLAVISGTPFHEFVTSIFPFIGVDCFVGIGGPFMTGRAVLGYLAIVLISAVLMAMADRGAMKWMSGPPESSLAMGCHFGTTYLRTDGYCPRLPNIGPNDHHRTTHQSVSKATFCLYVSNRPDIMVA